MKNSTLIKSALIAFSALAVFAAYTGLQSTSSEIGVQREISSQSFQSKFSYSWYEIANNRVRSGGRTVNITYRMTYPNSSTTKTPAVILLHGSGGLSQHYNQYIELFKQNGITSMVLDVFTPRGITNVLKNQSSVNSVSITSDVYLALKKLSDDPKVDSNRIFLVGFSKGGQVGLLAMDNRFKTALINGEEKFAGIVSFYPGCITNIDEKKSAGSAFLIMTGALDDYTPESQCLPVIEQLKNTGSKVKHISFADTYHGWDRSYAVKVFDGDYSYGKCSFVLKSDGFTYDGNTNQRITSSNQGREALRRCARKGIHIGRNLTAAARSKDELLKFIQAH